MENTLILSSALKVTRQSLLSIPPTEDNLHQWLYVVLNHWIPKYKVCEGHVAPYTYFSDKYFKRYFKTIAKACRSGGKTYDTGLYCWLNARFKNNWEAKIISGSLDQAKKGYEATQAFRSEVSDIGGDDVLDGEPLISTTKYKDGSAYSILAASPKQSRSSHQPELLLDEIDEMENEVLNGAMQQPQTMRGHPACWHFTSTEHKAGGLMADWVDNSGLRGYQLYVWCILEVMQGCYDYSCSTCKLSKWCGGRLKQVITTAEKEQIKDGIIDKGDKAHLGFNTVEDVINKVENAEYVENTQGGMIIKPIDIEADLFCKRPSRTGLVYKEFDRNIHVVNEIEIPQNWRRFRTFDFGITNPWVCLYIAEDPTGRWWVYNELYLRGKTTPEMVGMLTDGVKYEQNIADPAGAQDRRILYQSGIDTLAPTKADVAGGILFVKQALTIRMDGKPGIFFDGAKCPNTIWEIEKGYRYPENVLSELPVKENDHACDALKNFILVRKRGGIRQSLAIYS